MHLLNCRVNAPSLQETLWRTKRSYQARAFPAATQECQRWTILAVCEELKMWTAATATTFEKWYTAPVLARVHVDDVRSWPDSMVESPWQDLLLPHHVHVLSD